LDSSQDDRAARVGRAGDAELNARSVVLALVATLRSIAAEIKALDRRIAAACTSIPTGRSSAPCSATPSRS